jgi:hypothetical protein
MKRSAPIQIPFGKDGSLHNYRSYDSVWRENYEWSTTLKLQSIERGRSAAHFIWTDADNRRYPMFMKDLTEMIFNYGVAVGGVIRGKFTFVKRGQNYGIKMIGGEAW